MRVLIRHAREVGYCARGMRVFAERHGIDWPRFVAEGIDADELRATNDAMAELVIAQAEREGKDGQRE